ncbi:MAG: acyl--CoA ligase [Alphaproteobacteria bacterium]|nr:acyl--CoA ligase [Alphaproteobacteria bacterium]
MSKREKILAVAVPPWPERRRRIEAEPLPANVPALLRETAAAKPDHVALDFFEAGDTLTYRQLEARVAALAAGLAAHGATKGTHVAVMLPNVIAFPITWLAIATLGAVMVPVNGAYTPREVTYVTEDSEASLLIIDEGFLPTLDALERRPDRLPDERVIVLGTPRAGQHAWQTVLDDGAKRSAPPPCPAGHDDLLNIQYTSGTTGFPKGCMLTHRYWLTIGKVNARRDGRVYERILAATPFFYMDPQWLMLMAFYQRGTLYVARRQSASRFMQWVREHRINFTLFPEVAFKQPPHPLDTQNEIVRVNAYGLNKANHAALEERFDFVCREAFGMTEIGSGMFVPMEATDMVGSGTCGTVVPFRETKVVDDDGNEVPPGVEGELLVRGPGILLGYWRKPEATAAAIDKQGWFRTGDVFRKDARGFHFIVGRKKDMIRRAGENIAAGEVEAVLRTMPQVAEAAAVPVPDDQRKEEVKVYLVLQPGVTRDQAPPEAVLAHCERNLAKFKVPRYVAYIGALPKTASGKIAKHVLVKDVPDLRKDSFDRVDGVWR